ncbi:MAG: ECF transporter S component [Lachnospiraceae bacterium]|nr:ECF transporter S component [Lachnospiraceae bacterium]
MDLKTTLKVCFIVAIETIFCFTPLGTIPIGPIAATLSMVPVVIASLTFGKGIGMLLGGIFGLYSFIYWTFIMPSFPTAFLFTPFSETAMYKGNIGSLVICFVPRILAGLTPIVVSDMFTMSSNNDNSFKGDVVGSIVGSMTNTVLVLGLILVFFGREYITIVEKNILTVLGITIIKNGIPEAIICAVVCPVVVRALRNI